MATLTTLTLDADGTIGATIQHDAGTGSPFYTHCNDDPDSSSADYVEDDASGTTDEAWFSLSNVDADFDSMDTLQIRIDGIAGFGIGVTADLTARIFDADNDTSNPLTDETATLLDETDGFRVQRNVSFSNLSGSKTDWDNAYLRLTWTWAAGSGMSLRLFGCDIDGTYTVASSEFIPTMEIL